MKKNILFAGVLALGVVALAGCGSPKTANNPIGFIDQTQTARSIAQNSQNVATVDSDQNINDIIKMMNYQGLNPEDNQKMHDAIKKGMQDGKAQGDMDKDLIKSSAKNSDSFGTGYMLGYTFACEAATGNKDQCNKDIGQKYQEVLLEEFQNMASSSGAQAPTVPNQTSIPGGLNLNP
ncbi:MAG: hypothetical protein WC516_01370 [Patescibacteria group bacterium]